MVDGVDDVAVGEVGDDVAGDSVGSGVVVDSAKDTGGPRVVDDVVGEVADVEVVGKTNGETAGCIVGSAVGALGLTQMDAAPRWRISATEVIGDDVLTTYVSA